MKNRGDKPCRQPEDGCLVATQPPPTRVHNWTGVVDLSPHVFSINSDRKRGIGRGNREKKEKQQRRRDRKKAEGKGSNRGKNKKTGDGEFLRTRGNKKQSMTV
jgi:hypothetical protein